MAVQPNEVKKVALDGAFDSLTNSQIKIYLDMATNCVDETVWGKKADDAIKLLTAHYLTLASRGGNSGSVTSEKVGDLQKSFSNAQTDDSELATTSYGQMYLQMRKTLVITPRLSCPQ